MGGWVGRWSISENNSTLSEDWMEFSDRLSAVMSDMPKIQPTKKIQFFSRQFLNNDVTTSIFCSKFEPTM